MSDTVIRGRKPIPINERRKIFSCSSSPTTCDQFTSWLEKARKTNANIRRGNILDLVIAHALATNFKIN